MKRSLVKFAHFSKGWDQNGDRVSKSDESCHICNNFNFTANIDESCHICNNFNFTANIFFRASLRVSEIVFFLLWKKKLCLRTSLWSNVLGHNFSCGYNQAGGFWRGWVSNYYLLVGPFVHLYKRLYNLRIIKLKRVSWSSQQIGESLILIYWKGM